MFERFTGDARDAVTFGGRGGQRVGADRIGAEHVLLGAVRSPDTVAARALARLGVGPRAPAGRRARRCPSDGARRRRARRRRHRPRRRPRAGRGRVRPGCARRRSPASGHASGGRKPLDRQAKKLLELSLREAVRLKHRRIDTGHLLLAAVRLDDPRAAGALDALGLADEDVREAVSAAWAADPVESDRDLPAVVGHPAADQGAAPGARAAATRPGAGAAAPDHPGRATYARLVTAPTNETPGSRRASAGGSPDHGGRARRSASSRSRSSCTCRPTTWRRPSRPSVILVADPARGVGADRGGDRRRDAAKAGPLDEARRTLDVRARPQGAGGARRAAGITEIRRQVPSLTLRAGRRAAPVRLTGASSSGCAGVRAWSPARTAAAAA